MADTIHDIFQWWMSGAPLAVRIISFSCVREFLVQVRYPSLPS